MAIEAVASGKIAIKKLVTHTYELNDIQEALNACVKNKTEVVKGIIKVPSLSIIKGQSSC